MEPVVQSELMPLEMWADGIEEYIYRDAGEYHLKPKAPDWAKKMLEEYNAMLNPEPDENGTVTQY